MKKAILLALVMTIIIIVTVHIVANFAVFSILEYWYEIAKNVVK